MYELVQVSDISYYIQSPAKIGLVRLGGNDVCLIDSGGDKEAGRKARQILDRAGWKLKAIYNTHSNADHIGGNRYLQRRTGCKVYAPGVECAFTRRTLLEPSFLYGGFPPKDLRRKFLMAEESDAEYLAPDVLPEGFEIVPLPGHFFDMVGYRAPDGTVFLADCLSSRETLEKYGIVFIYDVGAYVETLERVMAMKAPMFVPSHAPAARDVSDLARYNIDAALKTAEDILALCAEPLCFEEILRRLFDRSSLSMNFEQYVLAGSTVRSYLSWLKDGGRLNARFENNMLLWERV